MDTTETPSGVSSPAQEHDDSSREQEHLRKRARLSCNACKARKTRVSEPTTLSISQVNVYQLMVSYKVYWHW